jgi:hypothetical protein
MLRPYKRPYKRLYKRPYVWQMVLDGLSLCFW